LPPMSLHSCGYFAAWSWADALPPCYLGYYGGCFATNVASVSPLWQMLCCHERDGPSTCGYFAASIVSGKCFAAILTGFSMDTLPPRLHHLCWQP
jgi:hypothetical protein